MQNRRDVGKKIFLGGMHKGRDAGKREAGPYGDRKGGIQGRRDAGEDGCRKGGMQERRDAGQVGYSIV